MTDGLSTTLMFSETVQGKGGDLRGFGWWGGGSHFETFLTPQFAAARPHRAIVYARRQAEPAVRQPRRRRCEPRRDDRRPQPASRRAFTPRMCDGSTRFVSNNVAIDTWRSLGTAAAGDPVGDF